MMLSETTADKKKGDSRRENVSATTNESAHAFNPFGSSAKRLPNPFGVGRETTMASNHAAIRPSDHGNVPLENPFRHRASSNGDSVNSASFMNPKLGNSSSSSSPASRSPPSPRRSSTPAEGNVHVVRPSPDTPTPKRRSWGDLLDDCDSEDDGDGFLM